MKTLVINLAGAPGAGKSTLATEIFSKLKKLGYNCEAWIEKVQIQIFSLPSKR